jgi:hypothetical protein
MNFNEKIFILVPQKPKMCIVTGRYEINPVGSRLKKFGQKTLIPPANEKNTLLREKKIEKRKKNSQTIIFNLKLNLIAVFANKSSIIGVT